MKYESAWNRSIWRCNWMSRLCTECTRTHTHICYAWFMRCWTIEHVKRVDPLPWNNISVYTRLKICIRYCITACLPFSCTSQCSTFSYAHMLWWYSIELASGLVSYFALLQLATDVFPYNYTCVLAMRLWWVYIIQWRKHTTLFFFTLLNVWWRNYNSLCLSFIHPSSASRRRVSVSIWFCGGKCLVL